MKCIFFAIALAIISAGCIQAPEPACTSADNSTQMPLKDAMALAATGECAQANTSGNYLCNENTGTWWVDLNMQKPGCSPACVINVATKEVGVNWRCTGLLPQ